MINNGLCQCGCGRETKIITQNNKRAGWTIGEFTRYIKGHNGIGRLLPRKKGYKHTQNTIEKIRNSQLGRKVSEETRRKLSESHKGQIGWNKGMKMSDEHRKMLSEAHKGLPPPKKVRKMSEELRLKLSTARKGISWSLAQREKQSKKLKGIKKSESHRRNMRIGWVSRSGKNHPWWKGGVTSANEKDRKSLEYRLWRDKVYERDDYICQECHVKGGVLRAHHIKQWAYYPELRFDIPNGVTLCNSCHKNLHKRVKISCDDDMIPDYLECAIIGEALGLVSGRDWKDRNGKPCPDWPHLQYKGGT